MTTRPAAPGAGGSPAGKAGEHLGACAVCGKQRWPTRKAAKHAARVLHPSAKLSTYQCGDDWHYGHPPSLVTRGVADRHTLGHERKLLVEAREAGLFTLPVGRPKRHRE